MLFSNQVCLICITCDCFIYFYVSRDQAIPQQQQKKQDTILYKNGGFGAESIPPELLPCSYAQAALPCL